MNARLNALLFENAGTNFSFGPDDPSFLNRACANPDFIVGVLDEVIDEVETFVNDHKAEIGGALVAVGAVGGAGALAALLPALAVALALLQLLRKALRQTRCEDAVWPSSG